MVNFISADMGFLNMFQQGNLQVIFHVVEISPESLHWGVILQWAAVRNGEEYRRKVNSCAWKYAETLFFPLSPSYKVVSNI